MPAFLFTDIEGSTRKWQQYPETMGRALSLHDSIIRCAAADCDGRVVKHTGDGFLIVFGNGRALECAIQAQRAFLESDWSAVGGLSVRMGIHSGEAVETGGDFFGDPVNRAARLTAAAWGGQVLVSSSAAAGESLPEGARLDDAGVHMLKDLMQPERIYVLSHHALRTGFPPPASITSKPHGLPVQPTPFLGRKGELAELVSLVSDPARRLVTILGHGGSGKTRIALQAAAELIGAFPHGSWFVPLEDISSLHEMVSRIAESLSLKFAGGIPEEDQLFSFLSGRSMLLVLDNFEHLTPHAPLVTRLLAASPGSKVIATSRHRLGTRGESVFDLAGMSLPDIRTCDLERFDSTSLFLASARRSLPSFSPDPESAVCIVRICGMLEGIPLAIELAASWIRTIPAVELELELARSLDILEDQASDRPGRQRSLQAVFDYSWGLLSANERGALAGLSMFEGGFDREAASEVAGCDLKTLQHLCDRSLVRNRPGGGYALHPLTRQHASERQDLAEGGAAGLEDRHCRYYAGFLERLSPETRSSRQTEVFDKMALEMPNLRKGALHAFRLFDCELMGVYFRSISVLLQLRSRFSEALDLLSGLRSVMEDVLRTREVDERLRTMIESELDERVGTFLLLMGRCRECEPYLTRALEMACSTDDLKLQAVCFAGLGNASHTLGEYGKAEENWSKALELARECGLGHSVSSLLCNLAAVRKRAGRLDEAMRLLEEALDLNRVTGDPYIHSSLVSQIADILDKRGDLAGAEEKHSESLEIRRKVGDLRGISFSLEKLTKFALMRSPEEAMPLVEEALRVALETGAAQRVAFCRAQKVRVLAAMDRFEEAWQELAEAESVAASNEIPTLTEECASARELLEGSPGT